MRAARHQHEAHRESLIDDAVAVLKDAQEALRLLPDVVTDVDTDTYQGKACVTPEAAKDALYVWQDQLTALLPEPADLDDRTRAEGGGVREPGAWGEVTAGLGARRESRCCFP
ncbi:hypothetical protein ABZ646_44595 [Streptomyces sp. NPDC007162]|uniref:hypothetical protein n=1 Tax=Streptomyces sp. NPDC007162 TaxID=3156917 RepID=UPI0033D37A98